MPKSYKFGDTSAPTVRYGDNPADKIYLGDSLIYEKEEAGPWSPPGTPLAWYHGNNTEAGGEWTDHSGNGHHAALQNGASITANGLTGNGGTDYADGPSFTNTEIYTFAGWVFVDPAASGDIGLIKNIQDSSDLIWLDHIGGEWRIGTSSPIQYANTQTDLRGTWIHFAVRKNAATGSFEIYRNGVLDSPYYASGITVSITGFVRIGTRNNSGLKNGFMDDVFFYNTALSAAQIADIYNNSPASRS